MSDWTDVLPHLAWMGGSALAVSLLFNRVVRSERVRARLAELSTGAVTLGVLGTLALCGAGLYGVGQGLVERARAGDLDPAPGALLVFGLLLGLAFAVPGAVVARYDARSKPAPRTAPATREDRRDFARSLEAQIRDVARDAGEIRASVTGDGDRVLLFEGDVEPEQGARLVGALRAELEDLGFKRVECRRPRGDWWERV